MFAAESSEMMVSDDGFTAQNGFQEERFVLYSTQLFIHLSHTDVTSDARILRSVRAVSGLGHSEVWAFGIAAHNPRNLEPNWLPNEKFFHLQYHPKSGRFLKAILNKYLNRRVISSLGLNLVVAFWTLSLTKRRRIQVVHVHDIKLLPAAVIVGHLKKAKLIYDAHELESERTGISAAEGSLSRKLEARVWNKVDLLISVSDGILDWYQREIGPKKSVRILNSPDFDSNRETSEGTGNLRSDLGLKPEATLFVYLGMLATGRGVQLMLAAFEEMAGSGKHVVFIGDGPLRPLVESYALVSENIHILKPVPHAEVVPYVSTADFGLVIIEPISLSYELSLPNKLFEFAFAGLPVVASDLPEISRVVNRHSLGVLVPPTVDGIIQGVQSVTHISPPQRSSLNELSQKTQAEKLRIAYSELTSCHL